jgi:hypothetical protein
LQGTATKGLYQIEGNVLQYPTLVAPGAVDDSKVRSATQPEADNSVTGWVDCGLAIRRGAKPAR